MDTLITNTLVHFPSTLVDSEKSFKGLQFGLDRGFQVFGIHSNPRLHLRLERIPRT